ncbi:MAG TPA: hypothetical protein VNK04_02705 [Gemmataceae bacterium]|nr:hypothetical protein [Gemmataceae bacterium]
MSTMVQSARGAAAFTPDDSSHTLSAAGDASVWSQAEEETERWNQWLEELRRLRRLEDDWDGEGAVAPHPNLVDRAIRLVGELQWLDVPPPDRIFPSTNGTIYFEWFTPEGYWEIEVLSPKEVEGRKILRGTDHCLTYRWEG